MLRVEGVRSRSVAPILQSTSMRTDYKAIALLKRNAIARYALKKHSDSSQPR
ncbi:MAG TPA: hypothetical protein V6C95_00255 [Coleofasciculaceae cyanobacterium]